MDYKECNNCYYGDMHQCDEECTDYSPISEQSIDEYVDRLIEEKRTEFRSEWATYVDPDSGLTDDEYAEIVKRIIDEYTYY